jgi:hypothetical protein
MSLLVVRKGKAAFAIWLILDVLMITTEAAAAPIASTVIDQSTRSPLGNVEVGVLNSNSVLDETRSDDGLYVIDVQAGSCLTFAKAGYLPDTDHPAQSPKATVIEMVPVRAMKTLQYMPAVNLLNRMKRNQEILSASRSDRDRAMADSLGTHVRTLQLRIQDLETRKADDDPSHPNPSIRRREERENLQSLPDGGKVIEREDDQQK